MNKKLPYELRLIFESVEQFHKSNTESPEDLRWAHSHSDQLAIHYYKLRDALVDQPLKNDLQPDWGSLVSIEFLIHHAFSVGAYTNDRSIARRFSEKQKEGGNARGAELKEMQAAWEELATPHIIELRKSHPEYKDNKLATELIRLHSREIRNLPNSPAMIVRLIRKLVRAEKLPEGPKDGRSKKVPKSAS